MIASLCLWVLAEGLVTLPDGMVREVELVANSAPCYAQGRYKNGLRDGMWAGFWPDNSRRWAATYVAGKRHVLFMQWRQDGTLELEEMYAHGKRHGVQLRYAEDGRTVVSRVSYSRGVPQ